MSYQSEVFADSPLLYYRLAEAAGTSGAGVIVDAAGRQNANTNGTLTFGVPALVPTNADTAVSVPGGAANYIGIPDARPLNFGQLTVEAWIKLSSVTGTQIVWNRDNPAIRLWSLRVVSGKLQLLFWTATSGPHTLNGAATLTTGTTYYVAASYDGTTAKVYLGDATNAPVVDGSLAVTGSLKQSTASTANYASVGAAPEHSLGYSGVIDDAAVYSTALSLTRLQAHWAAGTTAAPVAPRGTVTSNRANGILFGGIGYVDSNPPVVAPPSNLQRGHDYVKALAYTTPTVTNGRVILTPDQAEAKAHRNRVIVGGKDVTYFRDVPTPQPSFLLTEPLAYGATTLVFPQTHAAFEQAGAGDLRWLDKERGVRFERVNPDTGEVVGTDYRGVITALRVESVSLDGGSKLCWVADVGGSLSGRASLRDRQVPLFRWVRDIGRHVWASVRALNLRMTPRYGPTTGIELVGGGGMTQLDWINHLCSMAVKKDGTQYTLMPASDETRVWEFRPKDTTTRHATVYFDSGNIVPNLRDDIAEQPNTIFGTGVTPEGMKVKNGVYPGLKQGATPDYPMAGGAPFGVGTTDADTTGDRITAMNWKLEAAGYLPREAANGTYSQDTADAVEALQDDAGLTVTGTMDTTTWDALYDLSATGYSLRFSHVAPMAQRHYARRWWTTGTGARITRNGSYDPTRLEVHRTIDFGAGHSKPTMVRWARREISRTTGQNWVGTIKVNTGALVRGDHTPGTPLTAASVMPLRELRPGMNVWAPLFDGGTLLHVAGINIDEGGKTGTLTVDTKFRDMMTVAEIIERNRESRHDPARAWMRQNRRRGQIDSLITFDEVGGVIFDRIECPANEWTVFPVVAGQEGTIRELDIQTTEAAAAFCMSVWGRNPGKHNLAAKVGNPFPLDVDGLPVWAKDLAIFEDELLLYSAGDEEQPLGYWPKPHTDANGKTTEHPVTGRWVDEAQFSYHTGEHPVLWVAIYPDRATTIKPQRIMKPQLEEGA